jgi:hypothetical protein
LSGWFLNQLNSRSHALISASSVVFNFLACFRIAACCIVIFQDLFNHELGFAIRIDRLLRMIFSHRNLKGIAIGGAGRRKDEIFHPEFNHDIEKIQRVDHVVPVIFSRLIDGLAHVAESAIMHDRFDRVGLETVAQLIFIRQVSLEKMPPFGKLPVATAEVVIDNRFEASFIEDFVGVGTDVSGAAGDEDLVIHYQLS